MKTIDEIVAEARAEIEAFYVRLWHDHDAPTSAHLFHYTSTEGIVGILSSKEFFASDILVSDDRSEVRHGIELVVEALSDLGGDPLLSALLDSFRRQDGMLGLGTSWWYYAVCFCRGSDVFTQWREFSATGGFAIGVDFPKLRERAEKREFGLVRMLYDEHQQKAVVKKTIEHAQQVFARLRPDLTKYAGADFKDGLDGFLLDAGISLLKSIFHFKNKAFQSEDEWRVIRLNDPLNDQRPTQVRFRTLGNKVIPYIELPFEADLVSHIIRSPGVWPRSVEYAVQRLASSLGDHVHVEQSALDLE